VRKVAVAVAVLGMLVFAGAAYAGGRWMISSINQIKPSVRHQLQGDVGAPGPVGAAGPAGPAGILNVVRIESGFVSIPPGGVNGTYATCPAGDVALGGGYDGGSSPDPVATVAYDQALPSDTAWEVIVADNAFTGDDYTLAAVVECAPAPAGAAIAHVSRSTVAREVAEAVATTRAAH
jgi:hypothetical protein